MTARILPLSAIKGLGPARIKALSQAGVMTVEDLLMTLPARYKDTPDVLLMASGSEVEQMMGAKEELKKDGIDARVISMPCMEIFLRQPKEYQDKVIPPAVRARVAMEAGVTMPWYRFTGLDGKVIGIDHYGASAPAATLFKAFGFTAENACAAALRVLGK